MTRAEVIAEALTWIDTPWIHQACCKGAGVDCLHYIAGVVRAFGTAESDLFFSRRELHSYGREPVPAMMFGWCDAQADRIPIAEALPADVLVFRCGKHPMHFGFLYEPDMIIHAYVGAGRVCKLRLDDQWRRRIVRAYKLRGIE